MSGQKRNLTSLVFAALCFLAAAVFGFALVGYIFMAFTFAFIGCIILLFRFLRKRGGAAKKLRRAFTACLITGALAFAIIEIPIIAASKGDENPGADYLIVLGAGVNGTVPSLSLINRLETACAYLTEYPEAVALVSGGQGPGEDITEAEAMRVWLEARGIAPGRIIKEEDSTSTKENLENSLAIIEHLEGGKAGAVAIVSSEYHLYRAKYYARLIGSTPLGVPAYTPLPVLRVNYFIREGFAAVQLWLTSGYR